MNVVFSLVLISSPVARFDSILSVPAILGGPTVPLSHFKADKSFTDVLPSQRRAALRRPLLASRPVGRSWTTLSALLSRRSRKHAFELALAISPIA